MDKKITSIKDHIDKQAKNVKTNEPKEAQHGGDASGENSTSNTTFNNAETITNNYHREPSQEVRQKFDSSALAQGRTAIGIRTLGEKVDVKNMTPKEYRNFKHKTWDNKTVWDGVERRPDIQNWSEWEWVTPKAEKKPVRFVDKKPVVIERRQDERRMKSKRVVMQERRDEKRRHQDRLDSLAYYSCLTIASMIILTLTVLVIFYNIDWNK